jgi:hypothetical protein
MICYRDRTFCPFYTDCKHGDVCGRALTPEVRVAADIWWGKADAPIAVYMDKPECWTERSKL